MMLMDRQNKSEYEQQEEEQLLIKRQHLNRANCAAVKETLE